MSSVPLSPSSHPLRRLPAETLACFRPLVCTHSAWTAGYKMRLMPRQLARFAAQLAGMIPTLHDSIIAHLGMAGQHGPSGAVRLDDGDAQGVWAPRIAAMSRRTVGAVAVVPRHLCFPSRGRSWRLWCATSSVGTHRYEKSLSRRTSGHSWGAASTRLSFVHCTRYETRSSATSTSSSGSSGRRDPGGLHHHACLFVFSFRCLIVFDLQLFRSHSGCA